MKCSEKIAYSKKAEAKQYAIESQKKYKCLYFVYHCDECYKYHLTTMHPNKYKKVKKNNRNRKYPKNEKA